MPDVETHGGLSNGNPDLPDDLLRKAALNAVEMMYSNGYEPAAIKDTLGALGLLPREHFKGPFLASTERPAYLKAS